MAIKGLDQLQDMEKMVGLIAEHALKFDKAAKASADTVEDLHNQMRHFYGDAHKSFLERIASTTALPTFARELSKAIVTPLEESTRRVDEFKMAVISAGNELEAVKLRKSQLIAARQYQPALRAARQSIETAKEELVMAERQRSLVQQTQGFFSKGLTVNALITKGFIDAIHRSKEMNVSLIEANSSLDQRRQLTRDILQAQAATGNSTQDMATGVKALVNLGFDLQGNFKDVLETVVKMEEGLGVSYESSAKLAQIFQVGLRTPVREVADSIATIANNTALAADEATRFATEIGQALRLLGPGITQQATAVTEVVNRMAGAIKEAGGDPQEIIKAFAEMTHGTAQGFMARSLAGVTSPGALGTEAGARQALAGINQTINRIVTSAPGTAAYVAQLQAASEILSISTQNIVLYRDALTKANEPLSQRTTLEQRYREQITEAGKSLERIRGAFASLFQQGFLPVIYATNWLLKNISDFLIGLTKSRIAVVGFTTLVGIGIVRTSAALIRLAGTLAIVAANANVAAAAMARRAVVEGIATTASTTPGFFSGLLTKLTGRGATAATAASTAARAAASGRMLTMVGSIAGWVGSLFRFISSGTGFAAMIAGAVGYGLGRLYDRLVPWNALADVPKTLGQFYAKWRDRNQVVFRAANIQRRSADSVLSEIRQAVLGGREGDIESILRKEAHQIRGMKTEMGLQAFMERLQETVTEARERIGLSGVTDRTQRDIDRDRDLIEYLKKLVENTELHKDITKKIGRTQQLQDERDQIKKEGEAADRRLESPTLHMFNDALDWFRKR